MKGLRRCLVCSSPSFVLLVELICSLEANSSISLQPSNCPQLLQPLCVLSVYLNRCGLHSFCDWLFLTLNQEATMFGTDGFLVTELGRLAVEHAKSTLSNSSISAWKKL